MKGDDAGDFHRRRLAKQDKESRERRRVELSEDRYSVISILAKTTGRTLPDVLDDILESALGMAFAQRNLMTLAAMLSASPERLRAIAEAQEKARMAAEEAPHDEGELDERPGEQRLTDLQRLAYGEEKKEGDSNVPRLPEEAEAGEETKD